jgi:VCBS repeat-containing protein
MQPRFMPDLQTPADLFAAGVETDAYVSPLIGSDGGTVLIDTASETPPVPSLSNQDVAFADGQDSPDDAIAAPMPDASASYQIVHDSEDATAPVDGGGLVPAAILPAPAMSVPALAVLADPVAGSAGSHVADAGVGDGGAFETLAHADHPMFHASLIVAAPLHSGGLAAAAIAGDPATSAPAHADLASPTHETSDTITITEAGVGPNGATAAQLQAALDESGLNVNGTGIKVGVLSDSFNDLGGAATDEADGALPSASKVQVLEDLPSGGTDEGRAMMQIVHDIAPGASLAFYTASESEQDFANGILALAAAGCKVICDDESYFDEPFFQNGVVAKAIETVEAEGVTYVSAAGNDASNGYQAAWTPTSGTFDGTTLTDAESFGGSLVQTVTINTEGTGDSVPLLLEWNQPYGAATSDLEILVFQNGKLVGTATNRTSGEPTNPWVGMNLSATGTYQIAIENLSGPNPGLIKEITEGDGLPATISGANSGTVVGHALTPGVIAAGAVSAADTPAFGVSPESESFSSSGAGAELLFADNGTALSSPDVLNPVAVSGIDDVATTVNGNLSDFFGTSAASASLAGVAALLLSANPDLTPAQVKQIMEETALPMSNSAVSGAGLVQVDPAVAAAEGSSPVGTVIESFGSTSLVQVGKHYFLDNVSTETSVELKRGGAAVTAGEFPGWVLIGAEQTAAGYDVALKLAGGDQYSVWTTDSNGNYVSKLVSHVPGDSTALEALETVFHQDLNGDGTTGIVKSLVHTDGSTSLVEAGNTYELDNTTSGTGPVLQRGGAAVTVGEFPGWTLIGAVQTATGYDVALKLIGGNEYTVWTTDSNGDYLSKIVSHVSGTNATLESLESVFGQDLNNDGKLGVPTTVVQTDGSTKLVEVGTLYFLENVTSGTGPELQRGGAPVTVGEFPGWTLIGAVQTATGYDVALKLIGGNEYTVWTTDSSGHYLSKIVSHVPGNNVTLEGLETTFQQDLNGDNTIGVPANSGSLSSLAQTNAVGSGGTVVIDPPVKQDLAGGTLSFSDPDPTDAHTVTASPQNGGADYIGSFIVGAVTTANGQDSVGWHFNFDSSPVATTVTQSYDVSVADHHADGTTTTVTQSVTVTIAGPGNDAFVFHPGTGANTIVNATSADTIELDGFSAVTSSKQLTALLTDAKTGVAQSLFQTADGGHDTLINLGHHDSITLVNVSLSALHASDFIVH